jgi:predicted nucleic acid-binding protein
MAQEEAEGRIVLGDASALISLAAAGGFDLLPRLFGAVHVTAAVYEEIRAGGERPGSRELQAALDSGWLRIVDEVSAGPVFPDLGEGEAATLRAAMGSGPESLVILDDKLARATAGILGIRHVGTLGILLVAKQQGLVPSLRPYFEALIGHGFRVPHTLLAALLKEAGE